MRVALTGGGGFLGWHTRAVLHERAADVTRVQVGDAFDLDAAAASVERVDRLIHIAGVNRASDDEVLEGNLRFAQQLAESIRRADEPPGEVVYANSTQAGNGTVYGEAKARAADVLRDAADAVGAEFIDVHLPNLFGEHGRPFYNAVTATFSHVLAEGGEPEVKIDRELTLLHAQDAAELLVGVEPLATQSHLEEYETVSGLLTRLSKIARIYSAGEIPDMAGAFDRNLFNTYRSHTFPAQAPSRLVRHADDRGSFFEIVRSHGGQGQSSFSTTVPAVARGDHYHRRKIERFTVLAGSATISLRRLFSDQVMRFEVSGDQPVAVDMPTMWAHKIVNTGTDVLYTSFWANEIFDPSRPDTIAEAV